MSSLSSLKKFAPMRLAGAAKRRAAIKVRAFQYQLDRKRPLVNAVLFESFQGKVIGDSPYDIYLGLKDARPDLQFIWVTAPATKAPAGTIGVAFGSAAYLRALATSKYLVNNSNFPPYFRKAAGQIYLQTWHGTPLKRLGRDIAQNNLTKSYLDTMDREAKAWDYLISPNAFCTEIFPSCFGYSGEILEVGYPRNDKLTNATETERQRIRESIGVSDPSVTLVMYAPTWRDYSRTATGNWQSVFYLDENLELPDGFKLIYRGHTNTHEAHKDGGSERFIDVTRYPNITDLYLAADALITDYSSVMFDFTVTGKPIIFMTPDLERYRAERGFYFDFETEAPGPILSTQDEVVAALKNLGEVERNYQKKYRNWQLKFDAHEDGKAASRVITKVFTEGK
ncbi:MAG: CDP-glycerol glycerophosphotransferase family protein [Rhodoluna sp.]|nr:CDP-glycerol glycerophosphotransferase family protein [Rhodoluna sp.]